MLHICFVPAAQNANESRTLRQRNREPMVFHNYRDEELRQWLSGYQVIFSYRNDRAERFFAIQK